MHRALDWQLKITHMFVLEVGSDAGPRPSSLLIAGFCLHAICERPSGRDEQHCTEA